MLNLKRIPIWFFAFIAILATCLPLLHPTFFRLHDYVHAARIIEIIRGLQSGTFPVRWSSNFGYGYGMPLFEFYAPLPYYTGALFYALGGNVVLAIKLLFFVCSALTFLGMYRLGSILFGRAGGILSAVALTMAPYRALNLYVRGALSEAWGIMAMPWILLGVMMVLRKQKSGWLNLLFGLLVLFLSHNITTLIFIPMSVIFAVGYWANLVMKDLKIENKKFISLRSIIEKALPLFKVGLLYLFGIGLAAFYIFPAFLEKDYTRVNQIFSGYFAYVNHFLYIRQFFIPGWSYGGSAPWPNDGLSFFLGYGQLFGLGFLLISLAKSISVLLQKLFLKQKKIQLLTNTKPVIFMPILCLVIMLLAGYMTLFKSKPIWDVLPFMVTVQFPWRWISVISIFLALLVGMGTLYLHRKMSRYLYVFVLSLFIILTTFQYFQPEKYLTNNDDFYYTDANTIRKQMSSVLPDYIPVQMPNEFPYVPVDQVLNQDPADASIKIILDQVQEKKLEVVATKDTILNFAIADYPGWTTLIDGKVVQKSRGKIGNLAVSVPAGTHLIEAQFRDTQVRQVSDVVSMLCVIIFIIFFVAYRIYQKKGAYAES